MPPARRLHEKTNALPGHFGTNRIIFVLKCSESPPGAVRGESRGLESDESTIGQAGGLPSGLRRFHDYLSGSNSN